MSRNDLIRRIREEYQVLDKREVSRDEENLDDVEVLSVLETYRGERRTVEDVLIEGGRVIKRSKNEDGGYVYYFSG